MILERQIKIGTQQRMAHKRNLKKGTRIDLKNCTDQVVGSDDVAASDNMGALSGTLG